MARVKRAVAKRKHKKKFFKLAQGYWGAKSRQWRTVKESVKRAGNYAFRDRKARKREFRRLWIVRINAACHENGLSYSAFVSGLKKANVDLDRKVLSEMAVSDAKGFAQLCEVAKKS
jgi:large subunit ribosomal protein L20